MIKNISSISNQNNNTKNTEKDKTIQERKQKLKECISMMNNESKFKFWIKTLISSFNNIPEIIKTVDKIIEIQASSVSFSSEIFNKSKSTYNQVERDIDLSERKNALLNIYIMTKEMLKNLEPNDYEFLERKFIFSWSNEELSSYYQISIRTVYRKIERIIDKIYQCCTKHNWSLKFIENQISNEGWLKEKYYKFIADYFKNINYKTEKQL